MLRMRPNSKAGTRMLTMMMMPPIVGTPFFSMPNGSTSLGRTVSKILRRFIHLMKYSPNHAEITSDRSYKTVKVPLVNIPPKTVSKLYIVFSDEASLESWSFIKEDNGE